MPQSSTAQRKFIAQFDHVTYRHYGKNVPALTDVNVKIKRGSFTLLVGPSGSGKSTLCMMLNGIIPQLLGGNLNGRVIVDNQAVDNSKVQELAHSVGMLFQDPEWIDRKSTRLNSSHIQKSRMPSSA